MPSRHCRSIGLGIVEVICCCWEESEDVVGLDVQVRQIEGVDVGQSGAGLSKEGFKVGVGHATLLSSVPLEDRTQTASVTELHLHEQGVRFDPGRYIPDDVRMRSDQFEDRDLVQIVVTERHGNYGSFHGEGHVGFGLHASVDHAERSLADDLEPFEVRVESDGGHLSDQLLLPCPPLVFIIVCVGSFGWTCRR